MNWNNKEWNKKFKKIILRWKKIVNILINLMKNINNHKLKLEVYVQKLKTKDKKYKNKIKNSKY